MKNIRTDTDRGRTIQLAAETTRWLNTPPHTVSELRAHIDLRIADGIRAATYDGTGTRHGGETSTIQERAVTRRRADTACDDLAALDRALSQLAESEHTLHNLLSRYPLHDPKRPKQAAEPGDGTPPPHACRTCWTYGREELRNNHATMCDWCARFRADHGQRPPKALWAVHHEQGRRLTTADLRRHAPHLMPAS